MTILRADARHIPLRDGCVQCVVTSPPYFGLRDYGIAGQIGLERTLDEYITTMLAVFRELRRVMRDDATAWLNLGDSYAGSCKGQGGILNSPKQRSNPGSYSGSPTKLDYEISGLKPKDLMGVPWRVAFALQADGWYLRSDVIWAKPNPMPESVTDRPTRSHEYIFLLTKSARYYYDADAIREPAAYPDEKRRPVGSPGAWQMDGREIRSNGGGKAYDHDTSARNKRSVWTVNSEPTPEAHFATFPQKLIEPCILAGTSEKGCCAECGAPRMRTLDVQRRLDSNSPRSGGNGDRNDSEDARYSSTRQTTGWQPSCSHDAPSVPCLVFDPFIGSGTVGKVAERFGRRWVGCELSADYIAIGNRRTAQMGMAL